ncbi:MAG: sensor histidine kinase [Candidatus Melainabacteria bacterium]|nr:sensor histidine kinase [Candidatus Melainabacteria bacterium]
MSDFKNFIKTQMGSGKNSPDPDDDLTRNLQAQFTTHARIPLEGQIDSYSGRYPGTTIDDRRMQEWLFNQAAELSRALLLHAQHYYASKLRENKNSGSAGMELQFSNAARIAEPVDWISKQEQRSKIKLPSHYFRWKATGSLILSTRAGAGLIEFFIVPPKEVPHITMSEFGSRFRGRFVLNQTARGFVWTNNKVRLSPEAACHLVERYLDELLEFDRPRERERQVPLPVDHFTFKAAGQQRLELEKNNLLFKLLNQQEELKNQLARDLHDSVIADLMMLKRYLSGDRKLSTEETIEIVDEIVLQLRDIVNEYSPRQLQEWGLKVGIEDLLDRITRRTGIETHLTFQGELPRFPDLVTLHLFRIIQESLNNVEKHAGATRVTVQIQASKSGDCVFTIEDNGRGFEPEKVRVEADGSHSMGLEGMKERVELIRCFYRADLKIASRKAHSQEEGSFSRDTTSADSGDSPQPPSESGTRIDLIIRAQ